MMITNSNKRKQAVPKSKPAKVCEKCSFSTNEIVEFIEHMKVDHNLDEIYPCDMCAFYTESLWDYQGHMENHLEQKRSNDHNSASLNSSTGESVDSCTGESEGNSTGVKKTESLELVAKLTDKEEESEEEEEDEDEMNQSDIKLNNEYDSKTLSNPVNLMSSSLLTTITNANSDYYDKTNKSERNHSIAETECFPSAKRMIYESNPRTLDFNYSMPSNQSLQNNSSGYDHGILEKAKRHYNSEVDPARYRKVLEEGVTKFACSLCGNTYKWRKSLNKHWKEKHITEVPPPLDAPVTVKLRNGNTTINCIAGGQTTQPGVNHSPVHKSNSENHHKTNWNSNKLSLGIEKTPKNSTSSIKPGLNNTQASPLPFTPSLLVAAAAAANAATSGQGQLPNGQLHPAYWTVFHQYLNTATNANKTISEQPTPNKFTINHLTSSSNNSETPLDLSMKNPALATASRHSSINSSFSNNSNESLQEDIKEEEEEEEEEEELRHSKKRHSRRSDYNMQQLLLNKNSNSKSSSRSSSASSSTDSSHYNKQNTNQNNSELIKQEHYQSYTEDESLNITQNSASKQSSSAAAAAAAAASTAYNQKLFVCSICDAKFHVVDHINDHFLKNHYTEYQRELSSKSPPRNTNVAQQNEEWNLSDPNNPLKCIKCDFVGRWPTELQKHAASHSTSRPFKCLICSLTYKWRWDLAKHFDRTHPNFRNPYKKRDRDAARSNLVTPGSSGNNNNSNLSLDQDNLEDQYNDEGSRSRSRSTSSNSSEIRAQAANIARIQQQKQQQQNETLEFMKRLKKEPSSSANLNKQSSPNKLPHHQSTHQHKNAQDIIKSKNLGQLPLNVNALSTSNSFDSPSSNMQQAQQQFASNPMMAYFAALQSNMFQQQQQQQQQQNQSNPLNFTSTPSSSTACSNSTQMSPFSLLQQQQKNSFMSHQQALPGFSTLDQTSQTSTAAILAAAMTAIAQGGVESNNMSQLLPHLLQTMQQQSVPSTIPGSLKTPQQLPSTNNNNKVQESNYNSNLLSPSSSSSSNSYKHVTEKSEAPQAKKQKLSNESFLLKATNNVENMDTSDVGLSGEKEARNFLCYWCDFRGRWRSEIIQHMRCHHAREKPYRCSACMYASNWKWDVQKHTKKQHPNNQNAKIIEISDQILFPDLKDLNFFENVKPTLPNNSTPDSIKKIPSALNLTPPNSSSASSTSSSSSSSSLNSKPVKTQENRGRPKSKHNSQQPQASTFSSEQPVTTQTKASKHHSLCCQQCPYVACNLSDLRRHLIVHSNEQPYHCCSCDFKSKWKSDVKKHQRNANHVGPILVGKKAMQKVIENLGLDKNSMMTLYGPNIQVIDNKQCKSNEKLIDEDNIQFKNSGIKFQKNSSNKYLSQPISSEGSMKRKHHAESDCEEFYEQNYDEEEDYEQLIEGEDIEDEYEQVLAYNNNNGMYVDEEVEDEELIEPLNEEYNENQDEINSQFTDDDNNCNEDLIEENLNELEEEIDC